MTAIEFFDRTPIENVISSLTTVPDKIIFIGDGEDMMGFDYIYRDFLEKRGISTEISYKKISKNNITGIIKVLSKIVEEEKECVFDLTGGDDLSLVAMGIVFEKYNKTYNVQMQRFNINDGLVRDCDNDGKVIYCGTPEISVEENIRLHGGTVRFENEQSSGTFKWELNDEFVADIKTLWNLCRENTARWNKYLNIIGVVCRSFSNAEDLKMTVNLKALQEKLNELRIKYLSPMVFLKALEKTGVVSNCFEESGELCFSFKNAQIKRTLSKAGTVLELITYVSAVFAVRKNKTKIYSDVLNGVSIDWDGVLHNLNDEEKDTENEIDIILMKGTVPFFVSCKNGFFDDTELYKLDAVASHFGGKFAKKILIASNLGKKSKRTEYLKKRAYDMGIELIENVYMLDDFKFGKMVKNLVNV